MCRRCRKHALECDYGTKSGMTSASDLSNALQENLKLRRELATEVAEAKGEKLAAVRLRLTRIFGAFRHALFGTVRPASVSAAVGELRPIREPMTLTDAGNQPTPQRRQLDGLMMLVNAANVRLSVCDWHKRLTTQKSERHGLTSQRRG